MRGARSGKESSMSMLRVAALALLTLAAIPAANAEPRVQALRARTIESAGCPPGSYQIVTAPDGATVSVLFDNFLVEGTPENNGLARLTCTMEIPLSLPEGYSLGVYNVDYRGFAALEARQRATLEIAYGARRGDRARRFRRDIKGAYSGDFTFTERLRPGIMRRAGCGESAVLNFSATLTLISRKDATEGTMALDSIDGAPGGGLVFGLDLKKCRGRNGDGVPGRS